MEPITLGYSRPKTPPQAENLLQASNTNIVATLGEVIHLGRVNETAVYVTSNVASTNRRA